MGKYPNPQKPLKGINGADPFVIAMAKDGGAHWVVINEEKPGSIEHPKIPFVCNAESVQSMTFQQFMLAEKWQFR